MKKRIIFLLAVPGLLWSQETLQLKIIEAVYPSAKDTLMVSFLLYERYFSTVADLQLYDTHLYVNDQPVEIKKLIKKRNALPVKSLFVLDNSGSMRTNGRLISAVSDLRKIIEVLPPTSVAGLIRVSDSIRYVPAGKLQDNALYRELIRKGAQGNTPLFDSIYKALLHIRTQKKGLFSIIAFTDGLDKHSRYTAEDCLQLNEKLRVPITIFLYNNVHIPGYNNLIRISDLSGGQLFLMESEILHQFPGLPTGTIYTIIANCPSSILKPKWQNIRLDILYGNKIYSKSTGLRINGDTEDKKRPPLWLNLNTSQIMIGILILSFVLLIIWVVYLANRRAKTRKCLFCSKRYEIHLNNCPYCHQSTMNFYLKTDEQQKLTTHFPDFDDSAKVDSHPLNIPATKAAEGKYSSEEKTKLLNEELPTLAYLIIKKGSRVGLEFPLKEGMNTLGRKADNTIVIDDPAISSFHSKIWQNKNGSFVINDLATTNGTFVNNQKIIQQELKGQDEITVGQTVLTFMQIKQ